MRSCSACNIFYTSERSLNEHFDSKKHLNIDVPIHIAEFASITLESPTFIKSILMFQLRDLVNDEKEIYEKMESKLNNYKQYLVSNRASGVDVKEEGTIVLFYKYKVTSRSDVSKVTAWQHVLASALNLKGRIRCASEGINSTVSGCAEAIELYTEATSYFFGGDIDFKISSAPIDSFHKDLTAVACKEIVTLGIDPDVLTPGIGGVHLSPLEFHNKLQRVAEQTTSDTVILDCRNGYESKLGYFKGAITPQTRSFSEWPAVCDALIEELDLTKKTVLMYCTGMPLTSYLDAVFLTLLNLCHYNICTTRGYSV